MSRLKVRCMVCEICKELTPDELKENGEFVQTRKLGAVGFLKVLSLDMRELCKAGKPHQWEFEEGFEKEIHTLAKEIKDTKINIAKLDNSIEEYKKLIEDTKAKLEDIEQKDIEEERKVEELLEKLKEIAYIGDETLWS